MNKAIPRALRWSWCCPPYAIICSEIEKVTSVQFLFLCCERQTISNCVIKQWVKKLSVKINWTVHIFLLKKSHPSPRRPKQRYVHWFTEIHCFWNIFMLLPVWTDLLLVVFLLICICGISLDLSPAFNLYATCFRMTNVKFMMHPKPDGYTCHIYKKSHISHIPPIWLIWILSPDGYTCSIFNLSHVSHSFGMTHMKILTHWER